MIEDEMETEMLYDALTELVAAIDKKWDGESARKRDAALSPRIEAALKEAKSILGLMPVYATKPKPE
jgi:N12 class adenine-specific DNA methylase